MRSGGATSGGATPCRGDASGSSDPAAPDAPCDHGECSFVLQFTASLRGPSNDVGLGYRVDSIALTTAVVLCSADAWSIDPRGRAFALDEGEAARSRARLQVWIV